MHDRRTFLTFAAAAPVAPASSAATPGSITIPIGPFAGCEEPGHDTKSEKSEQTIDGERVGIEVRYTSRKMTMITLWKRG